MVVGFRVVQAFMTALENNRMVVAGRGLGVRTIVQPLNVFILHMLIVIQARKVFFKYLFHKVK